MKAFAIYSKAPNSQSQRCYEEHYPSKKIAMKVANQLIAEGHSQVEIKDIYKGKWYDIN